MRVEVISKFKDRVIFRQHVPKHRQHSGIKIHKTCDNSGYNYNMRVYYDKDADITTGNVMATHSIARNLTHKTQSIRQSF
jgi:hypothetical protein